MINLIIADDHRMFLDGIKRILVTEPEFRIIGEAQNGKEVIELLEIELPDVLLLDIEMPEMDGLETARLINTRYPSLKILILTMHNEIRFIEELLDLDVAGYVLKDAGGDELINAIRQVAKGNNWFSHEVTAQILNERKQRKMSAEKGVKLTKREQEVLQWVVRGLSSKEIASKLHVAESTIITHRKNILSKLNLTNTVSLVKYSIEHGLVGEGDNTLNKE